MTKKSLYQTTRANLVLLGLLSSFLTGCFGPKYIPAHYFEEKHSVYIEVGPMPAPSHDESHHSESDPMKKLEKAASVMVHTGAISQAFSQINVDQVRMDLKKDVETQVAKIFSIEDHPNDLIVEVQIENWGWIVPAETFGVRFGHYQLKMSGQVNVYDTKPSKKLIAHNSFYTTETLYDKMSKSDTERAIKKLTQEIARRIGDFMWRSEDKPAK